MVTYEGSFAEPKVVPRVWVVPYPGVPTFLRPYAGGRTNVSRAALISRGKVYEDAWHLLLRGAQSKGRLKRSGDRRARPRLSRAAAGRQLRRETD
jgi:hypothetical protein